MQSYYLDQIRSFEGYAPKAEWDYAQFTNGYGTRARYAGEVITKAEAEQRFRAEIQEARAIVEKAAPNVDEGTKAALTSLTYNAGSSWVKDGLGEAVRSGDLSRAREIFVQYNKAGGDVLQGLVNRRLKEAAWIGNPDALTGGFAGSGSASLAQQAASTSSLPHIPVRPEVAHFIPAPHEGDALGELLKSVSRPSVPKGSSAVHADAGLSSAQATAIAAASDTLESTMISDLALMAQTSSVGAGSALTYSNGDVLRADETDKSRRSKSIVNEA